MWHDQLPGVWVHSGIYAKEPGGSGATGEGGDGQRGDGVELEVLRFVAVAGGAVYRFVLGDLFGHKMRRGSLRQEVSSSSVLGKCGFLCSDSTSTLIPITHRV